ncbi:hypothetical protein BU23DRAFT_660648 [Bimuria novae-zelandiae CBS 107.79]|uniref:Uncharacterized protein n=1 Tax=Bimuria novae-zelandiae CBS 107.79 TaxID=1447943 RepID=A0A6A5UTK5_9PLEO|nr:hypothetical protein BU23DRAFT_660648 [Bimuria novae-zelandiae CBS 107.79]
MRYLGSRFKWRLEEPHKVVLAVHPPPNHAWDTTHDQYMYHLPDPYEEDKDDAVLGFIGKTLHVLAMEDINISIKRYKTQGLTRHPPVWPLNLRNAQFPTKLYAIRHSYVEFPWCISVSVEDRGSMSPYLTVDRVTVQEYPDINGTLVHVLGSNIGPFTVHNHRLGADRIDFGFGYKHNVRFTRPNREIFVVSRQMYHEAWETALTGTEKYFYSEYVLKHVLECWVPLVPASTKWLAKTIRTTVVLHSGQPLALILKQTPMLEVLTLYFPNPYTETRNLWYEFRPGHYTSSQDKPPCSPCYRTVVEWILILAFPYVKGINVQLQGSVKTAIKQTWDRIFATERKMHIGQTVYETHDFDYDAALSGILSVPALAMPPICACPKSCHYDAQFERPGGHTIEAEKRIEALVKTFDHNDTFTPQGFVDTCMEVDIQGGCDSDGCEYCPKARNKLYGRKYSYQTRRAYGRLVISL